MNKFCHETGVGLLPWSPLYRGNLARPLSTKTQRSKNDLFTNIVPEDETIINRVQELAEKKGWKMSHVALAWIIQKNTIPIVGFSSMDRLEESCELGDKTLTDEEIKYLEEPYKTKDVSGHQ